MIMILKKNNIIFIAIIFILSIALIGVNNVFLAEHTYDISNNDLPQNASDPVTSEVGKGKTVVLDPGHGGEDPGAVSDFNKAVSEKNINLYIAAQAKALLEAEGYKVIMTRTEDVLVYDSTASGETQMRKQDLIRRKGIMDNSGADIVVSIHLNKYPDAKIHGAQTFFTKDSQSSKKLAQCIQAAIVKDVDPSNTRVALKKDTDVIITKNCKTTTTIVECGFLSNKEEEQKLTTKEYQDKLAAAIKTGIDEYFKA